MDGNLNDLMLGLTEKGAFNTIILGAETVFDFVHLKSAEFLVEGIGNDELQLFGIESFVYAGPAFGFENVSRIEDYGGLVLILHSALC
jgi:hypothetical protein